MTENKSVKSDYTMVRIRKSTKEVARQNADKERRSIANYVENLILNDK